MEKRTYIKPTTMAIIIETVCPMAAGSTGTNGLDDFGGNGGGATGKTADAKRQDFDFWDDEMEE